MCVCVCVCITETILKMMLLCRNPTDPVKVGPFSFLFTLYDLPTLCVCERERERERDVVMVTIHTRLGGIKPVQEYQKNLYI